MRIAEHELVPPHSILSTEETRELLEEYGISKEKLPKIRLTDPVVKEIGGKVGDVLRITRNSPTAGKCVYYRLVTG